MASGKEDDGHVDSFQHCQRRGYNKNQLPRLRIKVQIQIQIQIQPSDSSARVSAVNTCFRHEQGYSMLCGCLPTQGA